MGLTFIHLLLYQRDVRPELVLRKMVASYATLFFAPTLAFFA